MRTKKMSYQTIFMIAVAGMLIIGSLGGLIGSRDTTRPENVTNELGKDEASKNTERVPGWFTKNKGQVKDQAVLFTYSDGCAAFLESAVLLQINNGKNSSSVKVTFPGSNVVIPEGEGELNHQSNFFQGSDLEKWHTNVPNFKQIAYPDIYDGIDLIYYSTINGLKYDWRVQPGTDPGIIQERYESAKSVKIDTDGSLIITTGHGVLREAPPYCYQVEKEILSRFIIREDNTISYLIGNYDGTQPLVVDPMIFSTYIGGELREQAEDIALDGNGNAYVTGGTFSTNFPTSQSAYQKSNKGYGDVFVFKLTIDGKNLVYSTFVGGEGGDLGVSMDIDSENNIYVTGYTESSDFPTTDGAYNTTHSGNADVFVFKLSSDGSTLKYSTYIGGSETDKGQGIALDEERNAYVTGFTESPDFPATNGTYNTSHSGDDDAFVCKLSSDGSDLLYSTYIGGREQDIGTGIKLDGEGNAYVTGVTLSATFPTTQDAYDTSHNGGGYYWADVFVLKLNGNGSDLLYSTFVGGDHMDEGLDLALDNEGNVYVTGYTGSENFPTTEGAVNTTHNGGDDVFVFRLSSDGSTLQYSTYVGGQANDKGESIAIDGKGNAYVTGWSEKWSFDFPTTEGAYMPDDGGFNKIILFKLNSNGTDLLYSTYMGGTTHYVMEGNFNNYGNAIAVEDENIAYVTGWTKATDFPTTEGAYQTTYRKESDVFVFKLNMVPEDQGEDDDDDEVGMSTVVCCSGMVVSVVVVVWFFIVRKKKQTGIQPAIPPQTYPQPVPYQRPPQPPRYPPARPPPPPTQSFTPPSAGSQPQPATETKETWTCPNCGNKLSMEDIFCWKCGINRPKGG